MSLFPSILPGKDFVDDSYTREELERMDWDTIRNIAKNHPSEDINGKSERETLEDYLEGEERL